MKRERQIKNLLLIFTLSVFLFAALGWVAFSGVGITSLDGPPVVVDRGGQPQPLRARVTPPEVDVRSEPVQDRKPVSKRSIRTSASALLRIPAGPRPNALGRKRSTKPGEPSSAPPSASPGTEPAIRIVPKDDLPPPERHRPPSERSQPVRELPIEVNRESSDEVPSKAELEANREWRRRMLQKWREEAQQRKRRS